MNGYWIFKFKISTVDYTLSYLVYKSGYLSACSQQVFLNVTALPLTNNCGKKRANHAQTKG